MFEDFTQLIGRRIFEALWKAYIFEEWNFNYNWVKVLKKINHEGNQRFPILFYYGIKFFLC